MESMSELSRTRKLFGYCTARLSSWSTDTQKPCQCIDISGVIVARQIVYALPHPVPGSRSSIMFSISPFFPRTISVTTISGRVLLKRSGTMLPPIPRLTTTTGILFPGKDRNRTLERIPGPVQTDLHKRQSELPAVGMSAEDEIDAAGGISIEQFRPVRKQKQNDSFFIPESFYFFRDELRIFFSLLLTGQCLSFRRKFLRKCLIRTENPGTVDADNLDFFAAFFDVFRLVLENMYPFRFQ